MDEAAFIRSEEPWQVMRPALSDKQGLLITTTTPDGKNWFYDEFWNKDSLADPNQGRVEYRSIDNPYFPKSEWEYTRQRYHPLLFAQEYMAAFDSMAGRDLAGEWLKYYSDEDLPREPDGSLEKLRKYIGVDPAVSMSGKGDRFVLTVVGLSKGNQVFLLDQYAAKIPFVDQLEKIQEYYLRYQPELIGIESNAYQAALVQQAPRRRHRMCFVLTEHRRRLRRMIRSSTCSRGQAVQQARHSSARSTTRDRSPCRGWATLITSRCSGPISRRCGPMWARPV